MNKSRIATMALASLTFAFATTGPVSAQETQSFTISVDGIAEGEEGSVIEVARQAVPDGLEGATCDVTATASNNGSIHPGNDLLLMSGSSSGELSDVEGSAGQVSTGSAPVVLGDEVVIELRFGSSGVTSGGVTVEFACQVAAPETTTTTAAPTTTVTTEAPTTTATTAAPPTGGVDTGVGGTAERSGATAAALGVAVAAGVGLVAVRRRNALN